LLVVVEAPNILHWNWLRFKLERGKFLRKEEFGQAPEKRLPQWLKCVSQQEMKCWLVARVRIEFGRCHHSPNSVLTGGAVERAGLSASPFSYTEWRPLPISCPLDRNFLLDFESREKIVNRYLMRFDRFCPALSVELSLVFKAPALRQRSELIFRNNQKISLCFGRPHPDGSAGMPIANLHRLICRWIPF